MARADEEIGPTKREKERDTLDKIKEEDLGEQRKKKKKGDKYVTTLPRDHPWHGRRNNHDKQGNGEVFH